MKPALRFVCLLLVATTLNAQAPPTHEPGEFLGYPLGSRFTFHHRIVDWFEHLAATSPRVRLVEYGTTTEGRPLVYAIVSAPANLERIDEIRSAGLRIVSSTLAPVDAERIARETPAVVWLGYGIHGNESSSPEAAMVVAGQLASGAHDDLLRDLVVIIDPVQNPDGRERYVGWFQQKLGAASDSSRFSAEHREPWPGGRFNHYLFDMNRDWAWTTQRESRLRVAAFRAWEPRVFVDLHEMGFNSSYFFPPEASPVNAHVPRGTRALLETFGRENARAFTERRWPFFVGERFDLFYPGYGDSWPSLRGSVGMTYEVAGGGAGGVAVRREDGTILTLADRIARHVTASMTTLQTAAANRETLHRHARASVEEHLTSDVRTWIVDGQAPNSDHLIATLLRQGIEVRRLEREQRVEAQRLGTDLRDMRTFPAGAWSISSAQPLGGLARTLLELSPALDPSFVAAQRARIESDENDQFYDVTVWSLPLAMNVPAWEIRGRVASGSAVDDVTAGDVDIPAAGYAWLVRPDQRDFDRFLARALAADLAMRVSEVPLRRASGETLPPGTLVIPSVPASETKVRGAASGLRIRLIAADSVWEGGTPLGSDDIRPVRRPRIALVSGEGFDPTSVGSLWHTLDVDLGMPHSVVTLHHLDAGSLDELDVVVLPDGRLDLERALGKPGVEALQRWVRSGGVLVAVRAAAAALRAEAVALSKLKPWKSEAAEEDDEELQRADETKFRVPGSAFRSDLNRASFLTWGVTDPPAIIMEGSEFLRPTGRNADDIVSLEEKAPFLAGFIWQESMERVEGAAWLVREREGSGMVITFADEPYFRSFWRGTLPFFVNAVAFGPTMTR